MPSPLIQISNLVKSYGDRRILDELDLEVESGECLVILGRSGSGKSVMLRQINGLEKPDSGAVVFDGIDITKLDEHALFPVRQRIGMLFQSAALFDSMNVLDNIAFPLREHTDLDEESIRVMVASRLSMVRLGRIEERMPAALSGGMKKRVALARSLALDPEVMLYDEPTTGLDPVTSAAISELISTMQSEYEMASVVVTHDLALARSVGDRVAFLDGGRFRFVGSWQGANSTDDIPFRHFLDGKAEGLPTDDL